MDDRSLCVSMHVCACVCMCVCVSLCMSLCMYLHACTSCHETRIIMVLGSSGNLIAKYTSSRTWCCSNNSTMIIV